MLRATRYLRPPTSAELGRLESEARRRRQAADSALSAWLEQERGKRDTWLLVNAQRDTQIADGIEELLEALRQGCLESVGMGRLRVGRVVNRVCGHCGNYLGVGQVYDEGTDAYEEGLVCYGCSWFGDDGAPTRSLLDESPPYTEPLPTDLEMRRMGARRLPGL